MNVVPVQGRIAMRNSRPSPTSTALMAEAVRPLSSRKSLAASIRQTRHYQSLPACSSRRTYLRFSPKSSNIQPAAETPLSSSTSSLFALLCNFLSDKQVKSSPHAIQCYCKWCAIVVICKADACLGYQSSGVGAGCCQVGFWEGLTIDELLDHWPHDSGRCESRAVPAATC